METLRVFVSRHRLWLLAGPVLVLIGWLLLGRGASGGLDTLTVKRSDFSQQVSVSGKVVAAQNVDLGFAQSGRITDVRVKVGNYVAAGSTLASVENGDLYAVVLQRQAALDSAQARLASLLAGTRPEQIAVTSSQVDSSRAALQNAINDAYRTADNAVHNTLDQFINNPRTIPQLTFSVSDSSLKQRVEQERTDAELLLSVWQRDIAFAGSDDLASAAEAQTNLQKIATLLSDANAALNRAIVSSSFPQSSIDANSTAVGTARSAINTAISAVTADAAALNTNQKTLALQQAGPTQQDVANQQAQVKAAQADLESAQAALRKTIIIAPFNGVVTAVEAKVGSVAAPDAPQISLISGGTLQIETYIPEISIVNVKVGDAASSTLDAYGDMQFASQVVLIDPAETVRDGVSTYKTTLQFMRVDPRIRPGMTADTTITTETLHDVIVVPQGAVGRDANGTYVSLVSNTGTVHRAVQIGVSPSFGQVQVLSGLTTGDVILLKPAS